MLTVKPPVSDNVVQNVVAVACRMPRILTLDSHQPQFVSRRLRSGATLVNNAVSVTVAALSSTNDRVVACTICYEVHSYQGLGTDEIVSRM